MGKSANQQAWAEFERLDRKKQEEYFEHEPPLSDEELASQGDDDYWRQLDAVARYAAPVRHVALFDEMGRVG